MKTGLEFYKMLSEEEMIQFDFNFENYSLVYDKEISFGENKIIHMESCFKDFITFIYSSFTFNLSKEGAEYWFNIANGKNN